MAGMSLQGHDVFGFDATKAQRHGRSTRQTVERVEWFMFLILSVALCVETFRHLRHEWFEAILFCRLGLVFAAGFAFLWRLAGADLGGPLRALFVLAHAAGLALFVVLAQTASPLLALTLAGLFLLTSVRYRGLAPLWWGLFAPAGIIFAAVPFFVLAAQGGSLDDIQKMGKWPAILVVLSGIVAILRETRARSLAARAVSADLIHRNSGLIKDLRRLRERLGDPAVSGASAINAVSEAKSFIASQCDQAATNNEFFSQAHRAREGTGYEEFCRILEAAVAWERDVAGSGQRIRFMVSGFDERVAALLVEGSSEEFKVVIGSLLRHAADSIGGGFGIVRVALKVGFSKLIVTIEDNGRGMGEDFLRRLESTEASTADVAKHQLRLSEVRRMVERLGGEMEVSARLGVGSRVVLEFYRIDVFAEAARGREVNRPRRTQMRASGVSIKAPNSSSQHA
jgi:signal transduction histidine kinase